jgi:P-type E1-E2 ATPase
LPIDKLTLLNGIVNSRLTPFGEVVGMVMDEGTNNLVAFKKADLGIAMGIQGTDVAKEASDIILLDDNLNSILKAMLWSRNIYVGVMRCLHYQLTVNFSALVFSVVCATFFQVKVWNFFPVLNAVASIGGFRSWYSKNA